MVCELTRNNNVYQMNTTPGADFSKVSLAKTPIKAVMASINYRVMHRRLMHANKDDIYKACTQAGIKLVGNDFSASPA